LVPCLVVLRGEFDKLGPNRDKGADGSIGDAAHRARVSDHNADDTAGSVTPYTDADDRPEVHAIDVDSTGPYESSFGAAVLRVVERHRTGADDRLQNVIHNRKIYSRTWGWTAHDYTGDDPHTGHAHFSARYTAAQESDTRPWGVIGDDDVTKTEFMAWMTEWAKSDAGEAALGAAVAGAQIGPTLPSGGRRSLGGSVNALVVPTGDESANGVANIINREVLPLLDAAEARIVAAVKPPEA
jgi:hypothetical protein